MIYLIGGAPRVGKSVIARSIAASQNIPFILLDDICRDMCAKLSPAEQATLFPCPGFSGNPTENTLSPQQRIELQMVEAIAMRGEIDLLIKKYHQEKSDVILEGVYLLPSHTGYLVERYGEQALRCIFIGSQDVDCILDGINHNTAPDNWLKESNETVRQQIAQFVVSFSEVTKRESERHGLPYFERTFHFEQDVQKIQTQLLSA